MIHVPEQPTQEISELLAGYALNALEPEEAEFITRNLPRRPAWRQELEAYRSVAQLLPYAAKPQDVPVRVRAHILQEIDAIESVNPFNPQRRRFGNKKNVAQVATARRKSWLRRMPRVAWAAAMPITAIAIAIIMYTGIMQHRNDELQDEIAEFAQMNDQVVDVLTGDQNAQEVIDLASSNNAPLAVGKIIIDHNENKALIIARDFPVLAEGEFYAVWLTTDVVHEEFVRIDDLEIAEDGRGQLILDPPDALERYISILITRESDPDVTQPTGPDVMAGGL